MSKTKSNLIEHQICNAEKALNSWPEWMKVSGQFQGSERTKNRGGDNHTLHSNNLTVSFKK